MRLIMNHVLVSDVPLMTKQLCADNITIANFQYRWHANFYPHTIVSIVSEMFDHEEMTRNVKHGYPLPFGRLPILKSSPILLEALSLSIHVRQVLGAILPMSTKCDCNQISFGLSLHVCIYKNDSTSFQFQKLVITDIRSCILKNLETDYSSMLRFTLTKLN